MRRELSKRRRAAALSGGVAAMSGTTPLVAHGHHVLLACMLAFEVVLLCIALRLLYESKRKCKDDEIHMKAAS